MAESNVVWTAPTVYVVGITQPTDEIFHYLEDRNLTWTTNDASDPTEVIEYGGRVSYESWDNAHRRTRGEYLQNQLIGKHHGSCLEHLQYNLIVADLPRSVQMETIRHRHANYSFTSQRYVDRSMRFIVPPALRGRREDAERYIRMCESAMKVYERLVEEQLAHIEKPKTLDKKRAREAARGVLPNGMASDGVISLNPRAARHFIELRTHETADASMREFAFALFLKLREYTPTLFEDAVLTPALFVPQVSFTHRKV